MSYGNIQIGRMVRTAFRTVRMEVCMAKPMLGCEVAWPKTRWDERSHGVTYSWDEISHGKHQVGMKARM